MQDLFEKVYDFGSLYDAYLEVRKGKRWKESAVKFDINLLEAISLLKYQLYTKTYTMSKYNVFKVYEPKERIVMSTGYKDKVVQRSLCDNVLTPQLTPSFILDNYASQENKGNDFGIKRLTDFMSRYYRINGSADGWVLKCDIRKYFYNIDHEKLKQLLRKKLSCPNTLWLCDLIIDSTDGGVGIPIGNQTSQIFAVLYLNGMDHYIKEKLGIEFYGRYMDDFYLIHKDKEKLKECLAEIKRYVAELGLELNEKTNIFPLRNGIDFLGFHFYLTETGKVIRKLRHDKISRMRRKLVAFKKKLALGEMTMDQVEQSYSSWRDHANKGNCYRLIKKMDAFYDNLFKNKEE